MAFDFTGTSGERLRRESAALTALPLTMCIWSKRDVTAINTALFVGDGGASNRYQIIRVQDDAGTGRAKTVFRVQDAGPAIDATAVTSKDRLDGWAFHAGVSLSATSRFAVCDDVKGSESTTSKGATNWNRTSIGLFDRSSPTDEFDGQLAEAAIWNVALSDDEILNGLAKGYAPDLIRPANLVMYWPGLMDIVDVVGEPFTNAGPVAKGPDHPPIIRAVAPYIIRVATPVGVPHIAFHKRTNTLLRM